MRTKHKSVLSLYFLRRHFSAIHCLLLLALSACGQNPHTELQLAAPSTLPVQSFTEFCQEKALSCPSVSSSPLSLEEWQASLQLAQGLLQSPTQIEIPRDDWKDPLLEQAFVGLGWQDSWTQLQASLEARNYLNFQLGKGQILVASTQEQQLDLLKGLALATQAKMSAKVLDNQYKLEGVQLVATQAPAWGQVWTGLQRDASGLLQLELGDRLVTGVDPQFALSMLKKALGLDTEWQLGDIDLIRSLPYLEPLVQWSRKRNRQLILPKDFWQKALKAYPVLAPESSDTNNLLVLFANMELLKTGLEQEESLRIDFTKGRSISCEVNGGETKINLAPSFGLKRSYAIGEDSFGLEFFGIEVKTKKALNIAIKVKRVEMSPDGLTIRDIPVVGKVSLAWDELSSQDGGETKMKCSATAAK